MSNEILKNSLLTPEILATIAQELNLNRRARKLLYWNILLSITLGLIGFIFLGASVWFSYDAKSTVRNLSVFSQASIISKLEVTTSELSHIQEELQTIGYESHSNSKDIDMQRSLLTDLTFKLMQTEMDLKLLTGNLKAFKEGKVQLSAGIDESGTRSLNITGTPLSEYLRDKGKR